MFFTYLEIIDIFLLFASNGLYLLIEKIIEYLGCE